MLETENLAALGIDSGHHMLDGAILAGGIHGLKNQQDRIAVGRVVQLLQGAQFGHLVLKELLVLFL